MHFPTQQPLLQSASSVQGDPLGSSEGDEEGNEEGNTLGSTEGDADGLRLGSTDGDVEGIRLGSADGDAEDEGMELCSTEGKDEGDGLVRSSVGDADDEGNELGLSDGAAETEGDAYGITLGSSDGDADDDGNELGASEGDDEGNEVGSCDGDDDGTGLVGHRSVQTHLSSLYEYVASKSSMLPSHDGWGFVGSYVIFHNALLSSGSGVCPFLNLTMSRGYATYCPRSDWSTILRIDGCPRFLPSCRKVGYVEM